MKQLASKQFSRFLVAGGIAALVNMGSRIWLDHMMSYSVSIILAYVLGMLTAFVLMRAFVFERSKHSTQRSFLYFAVINILAVLQTWGFSMLFAYVIFPRLGVTDHVYTISHVIGVIVPVFTSFVGHKYWSFRP